MWIRNGRAAVFLRSNIGFDVVLWSEYRIHTARYYSPLNEWGGICVRRVISRTSSETTWSSIAKYTFRRRCRCVRCTVKYAVHLLLHALQVPSIRLSIHSISQLARHPIHLYGNHSADSAIVLYTHSAHRTAVSSLSPPNSGRIGQ